MNYTFCCVSSRDYLLIGHLFHFEQMRPLLISATPKMSMHSLFGAIPVVFYGQSFDVLKTKYFAPSLALQTILCKYYDLRIPTVSEVTISLFMRHERRLYRHPNPLTLNYSTPLRLLEVIVLIFFLLS